jgi:hypothetical protein
MQTYKNSNNEDCVIIENADGSTWSGLKSAYDAELAQQAEAKASKVVDEAAPE